MDVDRWATSWHWKGRLPALAAASREIYTHEPGRSDRGRRGARQPDQCRQGRVEALVGTITEALQRGEEVRIAGFGTFGISKRGQRQGRNPQTGAPITIAASKVARFTAGKAVKDALNG
jgi:DNA-binding protein HU-beta